MKWLDAGWWTLSITKTNPTSPFFFLLALVLETSWFVVTSEEGYFSGDSHCLGMWLHRGNYDCYFQSQLNGIGVWYFSGADSSRATVLEDPDGSDLRSKRSAGARSEASILFCEKTTSAHSLQPNALLMQSVKNHTHREIKHGVTLEQTF